MTDKEILNQTEKQIIEALGDIKETLLKNSKKAMNSGAVPEDWKKQKDWRLTRAIIDSFCLDRPYKLQDPTNSKESENLHLFI